MPTSPVICFVVTDAISFNLLCRGQLEYFCDMGLQLKLVCGGSQDEIQRLKDRNVGEVIDVGMVRRPSVFKDIKTFWRLLKLFRKTQPESIVYSTPKALLLASIAARLCRLPKRVALVRGRVYENFSGIKRRIYEFLDRVAFRSSTDVIAISHSLREALIADGVASLSTKVLGRGSSNGIDTICFDPSNIRRSRLRTKHGFGREFVFLVLGRVSEEKGVSVALDAYLFCTEQFQMDDIRLLVVGPNEDDDLMTRILDNKHNGIEYFESTQNPEEFLAISDAMLFLSEREGFGNVAIEAAAMQVPVIARNVVGVKDSVANGTTGVLVEDQAIEKIAEQMRRMYLNTDSVRSNIQQSSRDYVLNHFDQERLWQGYLKEFLPEEFHRNLDNFDQAAV